MKNLHRKKIFSTLIDQEKSLFLIDQHQFEENLNLIRSAFNIYYPQVMIGYSYKTNYTPTICRSAHSLGCWAEVVSEMEVEMALLHLEDKSNIIYNGPIKSFESILKVIEAGGIINIDNLLDISHISDVLNQHDYKNKKARVALRLNFEYEGHQSRFGIEFCNIKDTIKIIENYDSFELIGYHLHLPFRSLESYKHRVECLIKVLKIHGDRPLDYINIGGGFFGNLNSNLVENLGLKDVPTFDSYGYLIGNELSKFFCKSERAIWPKLFIEPGSSVVADAVWFLSRIHTTRQFENRSIVVSYGGRHLLTPTNKSIQFPVELHYSIENKSIYMSDDLLVVGYTCIEGDILGKINSKFITDTNDFIVIGNVGSYSIVMGSDFILPQPAIYNYYNGELKIVRLAKTVTSILNEFIN